jgi:LPXTG-motif cell wall-anchored protein
MAAIRRVLSSVCQGLIVVLLANTDMEGSAMLMAFAGLILLFGIALLAVRRRD